MPTFSLYKFIRTLVCELGKPVSPDSNEFPENFRTAFEPPPPAPFSENFIAIFPGNRLRRH